MQRRAFMQCSVGALTAVGVGGLVSCISREPTLAATTRRLIPGLSAHVHIEAVPLDAPALMLQLEVFEAGAVVGTRTYGAHIGANVIVVPAPDGAPRTGRFEVWVSLHVDGQSVQRDLLGGYEVVPLRFSA